MARLPTDLDILNAIYDRYYLVFASFDKSDPDRNSKVYVPIDIPAIAAKLKVDVDLVFGRLYYHLDQKYWYMRENDLKVHLFTPTIGTDKNAVNFPYLASVLADMRWSNRKYRLGTGIAIISLAISIASFLISIAR